MPQPSVPPTVSAGNGTTDEPGNGTPRGAPASAGPGSAGAAGIPGGSTGTTLPPTGDNSSSTSGIVNIVADPQAASVPSQLTCTGRERGTATPFLVSPYAGWASVNSFLDHDNPDYATDGTIVLANGMTADAAAGQESDSFPAYWSPRLRQYVNYDGHNGYDFGISYQPVLAAGDGTVVYAGWNSPDPYFGYGQMILIDHHNGYATLYGHLSQLEVHKGEKVTAGEEIGISGTTGHSSGPHLHFSVFHNCHVTDPYGWTGQGTDPLRHFDGEHASYLWLPGQQPLVLNPPPDWPSYPAGLHVALPHSLRLSRGPNTLPAADRLLLLDLPAPASAGLVPGLALARTEAVMTREAEELTPYLQDLQEEGLIDAYQVIPAAAAIWVRGTASATQLESLPGVASLSGVRPADVQAAEAGLAHSVLIQVSQQQAPSLWPVGFRSALHAWRPVITVVDRHALVEGFALPGDQVVVWLHRNGKIVATAAATGDSDTGGFVTMLHNGAGQATSTAPGDVVEVQVGGRRAEVSVHRFVLKARGHGITGRTIPGATIPLTAMDPAGKPAWKTVVTSDAQGKFSWSGAGRLAAGTEIVATTIDGAGEQESASGYVPGMSLNLSTSTVLGWTVAHGPTLQVWRGGREALSRPLTPAPDGTFYEALSRGSSQFNLKPGDVVSIGSRWHRHRIVVPELRARLAQMSNSATFNGPAGATVTYAISGRHLLRSGQVRLGPNGAGTVSVRHISPGNSAGVLMRLAGGDLVSSSYQIRAVDIGVGPGSVSALGPTGSALNLTVSSPAGRILGGADTSAGPSGDLRAGLTDLAGNPLHLRPGLRLLLRDATGPAYLRIPLLAGRVHGGSLSLVSGPRTRLLLTFEQRHHASTFAVRTDSSGAVLVPERAIPAGTRKIVVSTAPRSGVAFTRSFRLAPGKTCRSRCGARQGRA